MDPDAVVLLMAPIHVRVEALKKPGRDGRHPFLVCRGTVGCELSVDA